MTPPSTRPRNRTKLAGIGLCILLGAWPWSPGVAQAAEPSDDIPGVPMPGAVATGRLGGDIYDVVYSLDVLPGYVIVASLTGAAGTDFDIYLFDSTATSVLSPTGLLTKSVGPTSSESISWPSQLGGRYYVDLNGATDIEGDYRLTVQVLPDQTPPSVSLALASGRPSTNLLSIPVALTATDDISGIELMAFSVDGSAFGDWQLFRATTAVTVPPVDGPHTVSVKVRNGVGLESTPASDSVVLDTVPPAVLAVEPAQGSIVANLRPTFRVTFNEPVDPASWMDLGLIVQSGTGALVGGVSTYDGASLTGSFTPTSPMAPGASYAVTVGRVTDVAGNPVTVLGSWSITPIAPTVLSATATPRVVVRGATAELNATLSGAPLPAVVEVLSSTAGGSPEPLASIPTESGATALAVTPPVNTTYRFRYAGAFGVAPAEVDVRVLVRRSIVLAGRSSSVVARSRVGSSVTLTAAVAPADSVSVSFRLYRFDPSRRRWVYAGSRGRKTDVAGRATLTWTPTSSGSYYWRVSVAPTVELANNISPVYRWSVAR